jgi:hypothetical protein
MRIFISYGDAADQVTALRLQALGAVNGLTVFVPPAHTRQGRPSLLDHEVSQKLNEAEVILGVVEEGLSEACRLELNLGTALHKNMIVMSYSKFATLLQPYIMDLVVINPANPDETYVNIVRRLKTMNAQQTAKSALLALGTLALGLFFLASAERE